VLDGYAQVSARRFVPDRPAAGVRPIPATRAKAFATDTVALARRPPEVAATAGRPDRPGPLLPGLAPSRRHEQSAANLKRVFEAGIPVALGTDAGNPLTLHGASVFQELEAMPGLGPRARAKRARGGDRNAARALGLDSTGTVTAGATADLVVLDADPLTDIRNVRRVALVVRRGEVYTRHELEY